jgi:prevent-host-death family protein
MNVKTAEFKAHLSHYLKQVREMKEVIIICDRDKPVAVVSPIDGVHSPRPRRMVEREVLKRRGLTLTPPREEVEMPLCNIEPELAPDRRIDISSIDLVRNGQDY